ncbi:hypothetical protein N9682_02700 [Candidatus Pelagibacter sp.]|nr:hypothetical protein [Candidatus Pelagibacter sp.]
MSKHNFFANFLKQTSIFINSLLKKKLNKLNFIFEKDKFLTLLSFKRAFMFLSALIVITFSYLSIPNFYDTSNLINNFKNQLYEDLNIDFNLSEKFSYNLFPKPNFTFQEIKFLHQDKNFASIDEMKIYISISNLFTSNNIKIKNINLNKVNFDLNKKNYNFFVKLLNSNLSNFNLEIKNSNIFYRNIENEVLFINKIDQLKYYYDLKDNINTFVANNEIFNIPYTIELKNHKDKKKIFTKVNFDFLKLQVTNVLSYKQIPINGLIEFTYNKKKSEGTYQFNNNLFNFNYLNKSLGNNFKYKGAINLIPFFSEISGNIDIINLNKLFNPDTILVQLLKSELLNNKNLNINGIINAEQIIPFRDLNNLVFKFRIEDGLLDISETKFRWLDYVDFQIFDSLLYVKDNNLVLDGNISIDIHNSSEIYKFFQTPRNYRKEIKKIKFNFIYNFDQKITNLNNIEIDNLANPEVNNILGQFISKETILQNRIYFKSLINEAIKSYAG